MLAKKIVPPISIGQEKVDKILIQKLMGDG